MEVTGHLHGPAALHPGEGRWVGLRASLDAVAKKKNISSLPSPVIEPRSARSLVPLLTELPQLQYIDSTNWGDDELLFLC
jgi:hypothetical protein